MSTKKTKLIIVVGLLIAIYPTSKWIWGEAAEAYFNYRCETDAGEFVYRTVENVEGLYQMRPRDPRDYFSRLRKGDIPEDPFGHTNTEAQRPWAMFLAIPKWKYHFLESVKGPDLKSYDVRRHKEFEPKPIYTGEKYWLYEKIGSSQYGSIYSARQISELKSQYGFTWLEVRNNWDKLFGLYGGELIVKSLYKDEILAIRRGYVFIDKVSGKSSMCPKVKNENSTYYFIRKVLIPSERNLGEE